LNGECQVINSLCIFCGSRFGEAIDYRDQAARLGRQCGENAVELVYGGGHVGLMGVVADSAMAAGGTVVGYIPERLLDREVGHQEITDLVVTENMFDRKDQMIKRSDAFAILPGGLGTLDELFEVMTLRQLGYHDKPIVLINIGGFWDPLNALIQQVIGAGFAGQDAASMILSVDDVDDVLPALEIDKHAAGSSGPRRYAAR
jgi:uncharacterized protein (TIGR00730 family)